MDKRSLVILVFALAACEPVVPPELADARRAIAEAARGPAATAAPAELHKAEAALVEAERAFADDPKAQKARDLAYVADRKARTAEAIARGQVARKERHAAERDYTQAQGQIIAKQKTDLADTRAQSSANAQTAEARRADLQRSEAELAQERTQRAEAQRQAADAERRTKEMQDQLSKLAMVREEPRGLVITLSGSVLFATNQAVLLPEARTRLDDVARALMASSERKLSIEGYTDSRGSDTYNLELSRRRAEAVRAYLVGKGYDPDLVSADGMGKARPVADNTSAEGRANNRRVEIVVKSKGD